MHFVTKGIFTVLVFAVVAMAAPSSQPYSFADCLKAEDCGPGECCVLGNYTGFGMQQFSIPTCRALGKDDDYCRSVEDNPPYNRSLTYPNGVVLETGPLHTLFCPCDFGLTCRRAHCVSQAATDSNRLSRR